VKTAVIVFPGSNCDRDLAVALEQMGDFAGARQAYEKALELKPNDTYIQQNYDLFREADDKRNRKAKGQKLFHVDLSLL